MSDDWIDKMLREALNEKPESLPLESRSHRDFEQEYDGIKKGMYERDGRAMICAAAALATATSCLRVAANLPPVPTENDIETLKEAVLFLCRVLTKDQMTFLPATLAGIILREASQHD